MHKLLKYLGCGSQQIFCFEEGSSIYKCNNCSLFFVNPRPPMSFFDSYYTRECYGGQANKASTIERNAQRLSKILLYNSSGRLLDVSCGNGVFLNLASQYFDVEGLDISKASIESIKKHFDINAIVSTLENYETSYTWKDVYFKFCQLLKSMTGRNSISLYSIYTSKNKNR